ncbi:unnamed protein product [Caenorhabditis angaria]|uniref:STAS domain-containing protein n=1 Tax=Caenorhabditis angaria TaxID=860376 RepID=A0A9P1N0R1_9PELO|nr:unnamed protein product [Caenorhabditis angaria]
MFFIEARHILLSNKRPAISIAIISFVIHIALCKLIAKKLNYVIDSNQEWMALGLMHTTSAFFGCFAGGSSLGRTMMQMKIGTKTQLSTIVCAMVLVVFVMGAGRFIYFLPKPVLASIVVMAMKDLFVQLYTAMTIRKTSFFDFMIFVITLTAVLILNVNYGLVVGVAFALLTVVFRTQWADSTLLGRVKGTNHFKGLSHYGAALEIPGIKVFRFDSPLYFANSELFLSRVYSTCGLNPVLVRGKLAEEEKRAKAAEKKRKRREDAEMLLPNTKDETQLEVKGHHVKALNEKTTEKSMGRKEEYEITQLTHIIIDCSSIPYIDLMGLDAIVQIYQEYKTIDIDVLFANTKEVCRQLFDVTDFFKKVPINRMFVSISDAVQQAKLEQQAKYLQGNDQSLRAAPNPIKPLATNQPVAKSVAQKTMPLGGDFTNTALQLPPTQSASVATMVEKSIFSEENPDKRRQKMGEDLDKTQ